MSRAVRQLGSIDLKLPILKGLTTVIMTKSFTYHHGGSVWAFLTMAVNDDARWLLWLIRGPRT